MLMYLIYLAGTLVAVVARASAEQFELGTALDLRTPFETGPFAANITDSEYQSYMRTRVAFSESFLPSSVMAATDPCEAKLTAHLVTDESGSVGYYAWEYDVIPAHTAFVNAFEISADKANIGITTFSDNHKVKVAIGTPTSRNKNQLLTAIQGMITTYVGGGTSGYSAFVNVRDVQYPAHVRARGADVPFVMVVFTDGIFWDASTSLAVANELRAREVTIIGLGVGAADTNFLTQVTGDPNLVFSINNFSGMLNAIQQIAKKVCTIPATLNPTLAPSRKPTTAPSLRPTRAPSLAPTGSPTEMPREFCENEGLFYQLLCNPYWLLLFVPRRLIQEIQRAAEGRVVVQEPKK